MPEAGGFRRDVAVVLSGGGALAAYEAGVMRAVLGGETEVTGYQILDPGIITGTSAGGLNAALMISRLDAGVMQALDYLDHVWLEELAAFEGENGVFRVRLDPLALFNAEALTGNPLRPFLNLANDGLSLTKTLIRRGSNFLLSTGTLESRAVDFADLASLISCEPLPVTLRRVLDLNAVQRSHRSLRVAAANWTTGEVKVFTNQELAGDYGYLALQGSAAIPGIFPPVIIDDETYVDGGLVMNTPLKPAIDAGASELHVIYLDPRINRIPTTRLESTLDVFERSLAIAFATMAMRDIEAAALINEGIRLGLTGGVGSAGTEPGLKLAAQIVGRLQASSSETRSLRPLTIHRYHPPDDLGSGLSILDFSRSSVQKLIDRGFQDGIRHDCTASECVLP